MRPGFVRPGFACLSLWFDSLVRGRVRLLPKKRQVVHPNTLFPLTFPAERPENPFSVGTEATTAVAGDPVEMRPAAATEPGLRKIKATHE